MTDHELEQRLQRWYRAEIGEAEGAPAALRTSVAAIPAARSTSGLRLPWRFRQPNMLSRLAAAAAIGVLVVGAGLYVTRPTQPAVGGPSPTPGASAGATSSAAPSAIPSSSAVPARAASWTATGSMINGYVDFETVTLLRDGKVLKAGGYTGNLPVATAELYDPVTGTWTATGSMTEARSYQTATLLPDGQVLVAGGTDASFRSLATAELYDPVTGTWTATGRMTEARSEQTATLLPDGQVLLVGGWSANSTLATATAELYDPVTGTWTATGSMTEARSGQTATRLSDGRVLVVGGSNASNRSLATAELYDPGTGSWTAAGSVVSIKHEWHTATLLRDGGVLLLASGFNGSTDNGLKDFAASAGLYDPSTGTWDVTESMINARLLPVATLLSDGRVLVAGGSDGSGGGDFGFGRFQASAEVYDPDSGSWTLTASMLEPNGMGGIATLLLDGKVLVLVDGWVNPAEVYDPGSGE